ncbi:hypothetical protein XENOCAPTIV_021253, partial [Xenoophorus captivus]
ASIIAFIQASRAEVKKDFTKTMDLLRKELGGFSTRDGWKAKQNGCRDERNHRGSQRVMDMEDLNTEGIEALARSLQLQEKVQAQFTDLEAAQGETIYASSEFPRGLKVTTYKTL